MRINELETRNVIDGTEFIVVDTTEGTKKTNVSNLPKSMIVAETKEISNITVNSNSSFETGAIPVNKDGYLATGIVGYEMSGNYSNTCLLQKIKVVDPWNINIKLYNSGAVTADVTIKLFILYIKN